MIDLCLGPHIPNTGRIKAMMITKVSLILLGECPSFFFLICRISQNSASYFLGDPTKDSLQRLWGISFPETKQLTEYKEFLAEAAKRDHRKIGKVWATHDDCFIYDLTLVSRLILSPIGARTILFPRVQSWKRVFLTAWHSDL